MLDNPIEEYYAAENILVFAGIYESVISGISIVFLVIAVHRLQKVIKENPGLGQSHKMMRFHFGFIVLPQVVYTV